MARPKKQLNRRTEILEAAQFLFAEKGFEKTTINEIAKHIGIGKGSVYLDFNHKYEILLAIIEQNSNIMLEKLELQLKNAKPPYLQLLEQVLKNDVTTVFDMATSHIHTHMALMHTSYQFKQDLNHLIQKGVNIIAILLNKAADNKEIKPVSDYEKMAHLIRITLQGVFPPYDLKYSLEHRDDLSKEEIRTLLFDDAAIIIKIILSGLKVQEYEIK